MSQHRKFKRRQIAAARIRNWIVRRRRGRVMSPVKGHKVTYPYGVKSSRYQAGHHTGEDIACSTGSPAMAVSFGRVVDVGWGVWGDAYGKQVVVEMPKGRFRRHALRYAHNHLSDITVREGARVRPGMVLGKTGATGNVTGPHDHFEARRYPWRYGNDVHPMRAKKRRRK